MIKIQHLSNKEKKIDKFKYLIILHEVDIALF